MLVGILIKQSCSHSKYQKGSCEIFVDHRQKKISLGEIRIQSFKVASTRFRNRKDKTRIEKRYPLQ
jgi:hypothetical protein